MNVKTQRKSNLEHPPRAKLTFRIGVVGHRWHRLKQADLPQLQTRVSELLKQIHDCVLCFAKTHSRLYVGWPIKEGTSRELDLPSTARIRIVSSLAEGADRIVAEQAIGLGFELQCPMPFAQAEFEEDFKPRPLGEPEESRARAQREIDTVAEFRALLDRAMTETDLVKFEMDGDRAEQNKAYAAAARVVLNQSDILFLVWDGQYETGLGGTLDTLRHAFEFNIPVVWIDARAPHDWQLLSARDDLADPTGSIASVKPTYQPTADADRPKSLRRAVERVLLPPMKLSASEAANAPSSGELSPEATSTNCDLRENYFVEHQPHWRWAFFWKLFRDVVGDNKCQCPVLRVPEFVEEIRPVWPGAGEHYFDANLKLDGEPTSWEAWLHDRLRVHYAWSDKLADYYADKHRSSFLLISLLGIFAVVAALFPLLCGWQGHADGLKETVAIGVELLAIVLVIWLVWWGNHRRWRQRWLDYRVAAELIRQLRFLAPLGTGMPIPRVAAHLTGYGNPAETWMYWHVRAIERELGLPNLRLDRGMLIEYLHSVGRRLIDGQIDYHRDTERRMNTISHRLHHLGTYFFVATLLACLWHFVPDVVTDDWHDRLVVHHHIPDVLTVLAAVFPACGAALFAIHEQGEFQRVANRCSAMHLRLYDICKIIESMQAGLQRGSTGAVSSDIAEVSARAIQLMVDEVLDWRVMFRDRILVAG